MVARMPGGRTFDLEGCLAQAGNVIASVTFRNFKALRATRLELQPCNMVIGPNGSGKSSLIQAMLQLRTLARLPLREAVAADDRLPQAAEITFRFRPPYDGLEASLGCVSDTRCDLLQVVPLPSGEGGDDWPGLKQRLLTLRAYLFDHERIAAGKPAGTAQPAPGELAADGGNLGTVLAHRQAETPVAYAEYVAAVLRVFTEYADLDLAPPGGAPFALTLRGEGTRVPAHDLSQGTLYLLALLALAHDPAPPALVCVEEVDRGIHPRKLRAVQDALYRLSHPESAGLTRSPAQVIATTHSPYLLDLYRDTPEEVVLAAKAGRVATFSRLDAHPDLAELLQGASLGDLWYSGVIGGVPEEQDPA
jgi:predicted ATPase